MNEIMMSSESSVFRSQDDLYDRQIRLWGADSQVSGGFIGNIIHAV
jgi:hypothetical protein